MTAPPARTTMEGMIWHANDILTKVVSDKTSGIPQHVVANCHGVAIVSVVEVGAIFSGSRGAGIIMAKDPAVPGLKWSPPCACSLSGIGFGLLVVSTCLLIGQWYLVMVDESMGKPHQSECRMAYFCK